MNAAPPKAYENSATIHGSPGARVRLIGLARSLWPLIVVFILFGYLIRCAIPTPALSMSITGVLFLALAVAVAAAANYSRERLARFLKGAQGEETVARVLDRLPSGWHVFHGVGLHDNPMASGGGADIDHVIVAPHAIFVIETKNWHGDVTVRQNALLIDDEQPDLDPIEQVKASSERLQRELNHTARETASTAPPVPILCFTRNAQLNGITGLAGVMICTVDGLCAMMQTHRERSLPEPYRKRVIETLISAVES